MNQKLIILLFLLDTLLSPGAVVRSAECPLCEQCFQDRPSRPAHSFFEKNPDSRRASCQLLVKEWALNTGKLPPEGLPRNSVVK